MSELICPKCQAALQDDLVESTGRAECPFCGANVSGLFRRDAQSSAQDSMLFGETPRPAALNERDDGSNKPLPELDPATAERILTEAGCEISEPEPGVTRIACSIRNCGPRRGVVLIFGGSFAAVWIAMFFGMAGVVLAGNDDPVLVVVLALFLVVMTLMGMLPLILASWAWRGQAMLDFEATGVIGRIGAGKLRLSRRFALDAITRVGPLRRTQPGTVSRSPVPGICVLEAGKKMLPLMIQPNVRLAGALSAFVRHQLGARGCVVPDE